MKSCSSPNFNARAPDIALNYIVLHYTGMTDAAAALARLCDPAAQVSAHYMIDEDGGVTQLVDEAHRAWHAGVSRWRDITDINSASIGIELVNPGHEFGYRPFRPVQIAALKILLRQIVARHGMNPTTCLLAHSDIAPARKEDPGELFPWQDLAQEGLGLWPQAQSPAPPVETLPQMLAQIGYDTSDIAKTIMAFQRRYRPASLSGIADEQTQALIAAVARAQK